MATCPKCGGHLTSHHRCRRSTAQITTDVIVMAMVGGIWALAMAAVFDRNGQTSDRDAIFFVVGALTAIGIQASLRRR